jgi:quercetin dioxygenase-like cupin family protein
MTHPAHEDHGNHERGVVYDLAAVATELAAAAREHPSGRDARTIVATTSQRVTVIALNDGAELSEHQSPPSATLQVLSGSLRLHAGDDTWDVAAGQLVGIPPQRHGVTATSDCVFVLTVALR